MYPSVYVTTEVFSLPTRFGTVPASQRATGNHKVDLAQNLSFSKAWL